MKKYLPFIGVGLIFFYFVFHLFLGNRNVMKWLEMNTILKEKEHQLKKLNEQESYLLHKVSLLKNKIDKDLLDERVRHILHYANSDEIVLYLDSDS